MTNTHIKHKITNLQHVMQLKPEKKHLSWEEDYNPKNIIFKFNIYIYSNIHLHDYKAFVTQLSKQRPFSTIQDSSFVSKI